MYDKDFDDINMDNMGEGRPPYDLPELSGPAPQPGKDEQEFLDGLDIGQNVPNPSVANGLAQNYNDGTVISDEIFEDSTQFVENDASASQEDVLRDESVQPEKPKSNSSTVIIIVVLAIITIVGALGFIYSNEISLMVSKAMVAFQNGEDTASQEQNDSNDLIANGSGDSTGETEEMTDEINITRKNPNVMDVEQMANSSGMTNQEIPALPGAMNPQNVPPFENGSQIEPNVYIPMSSGTFGRVDPFNPTYSSKSGLEVLLPPTAVTPDQTAQQLMGLKISGIMYTADSPSAIINVDGSDQLVRRGDKFNGFVVERITQDKVTVRNGNNTYTASVGEEINPKNVGVNAIPNLNRKFAGPYSKGERIIEINTLN